MSYITSFIDGESYGAFEVNKITSRFVTAGIEDPFVDGVPYNVRRLNDLSKAVTTRGVIGSESNAIKCIKSGEGYYLAPGTAFFGNGSTLEIISNEPVSLQDTSVKNYVYLRSSEEENRNHIVVSTQSPDLSDENIVPICEINTDGTITDRRCYATGKIRGMYQSNEHTLKCIRIQDSIDFSSTNEVNIDHDLGCDNLSFVFFKMSISMNEEGNYDPDNEKSVNLYGSNTACLWIPSEDRYIGVSASTYLKPDGFVYCYDSAGFNDIAHFALSVEKQKIEKGFYLRTGDYPVALKISHRNGTTWRFNYYCYAKTTTPYPFDFKLYYI